MIWPTFGLLEPFVQEPKSDQERELLILALARDAGAVRALVALLTPVVRARVTRALLRRYGSDPAASDVADLSQEVFVSLFTADAKALRAWQPERGLSLRNFVGLLAQHRVAELLRHSSWRGRGAEVGLDDSHLRETGDGESRSAAQLELAKVLSHLEATLSVRGLEMFERLCVRAQAVEEICAETGLSAEAVYQWRSRLSRAAREAQAAVLSAPAGSKQARRRLAFGRSTRRSS